MEGSVAQIYCPAGVAVDVGCPETFGFLEVEEFEDGFPSKGPFGFRRGDWVSARVLDVNPDFRARHGVQDPHGDYGDSGRLHLTLRSGGLGRPPRYAADPSRAPPSLAAFQGLGCDAWLHGEVVMMSSWAAYVKVAAAPGEDFVGLLYPEEFDAAFAAQAIRGLGVRVRIKELDIACRRMLLTMRGAEPA